MQTAMPYSTVCQNNESRLGDDEMERFSNISMAVVRRLPKYYRYLGDLISNEVSRISSQDLSRITGFTASQIRQDLNCFGGFGQQGYGYNVSELYDEIGKILGLNRTYNTILAGAGNMGRAIANYTFFRGRGFQLCGIFDCKPEVIGTEISGVGVYHVDTMTEFIKDNNIEIGIICTPKDSSQQVAETMTKSGVKAIWNFAPVDLKLPDDVIVENVHLSESLFTVSYLMKEHEENNRKRDKNK